MVPQDGLYWDPNNMTVWMWPVGGSITYQNWELGQKKITGKIENSAYIMPNGQRSGMNGILFFHWSCFQESTIDYISTSNNIIKRKEEIKNL